MARLKESQLAADRGAGFLNGMRLQGKATGTLSMAHHVDDMAKRSTRQG